MQILIITIHVVVSLILILVVLLQTGKGADMGAAFGGGSSQTLFGATGASTFLSKTTTFVAIVFMLTSLILAYIASNRIDGSVMSSANIPVTQTAPVTDNSTEAETKSEIDEPNPLPADQGKQSSVAESQADNKPEDVKTQAQPVSKSETQKQDIQ